jgi:hypothetical protein
VVLLKLFRLWSLPWQLQAMNELLRLGCVNQHSAQCILLNILQPCHSTQNTYDHKHEHSTKLSPQLVIIIHHTQLLVQLCS